jgi:hypothetical protein
VLEGFSHQNLEEMLKHSVNRQPMMHNTVSSIALSQRGASSMIVGAR